MCRYNQQQQIMFYKHQFIYNNKENTNYKFEKNANKRHSRQPIIKTKMCYCQSITKPVIDLFFTNCIFAFEYIFQPCLLNKQQHKTESNPLFGDLTWLATYLQHFNLFKY